MIELLKNYFIFDISVYIFFDKVIYFNFIYVPVNQ